MEKEEKKKKNAYWDKMRKMRNRKYRPNMDQDRLEKKQKQE